MSLILLGLCTNLDDLRHREYYLLLTAEELQVATAVRTQTPERAIFLIGLQHNHPVPMLAGRSVVLGYPGWLSSWGFEFAEREHDVRAIYALAPEAPQLLRKYHVDYVVIGPVERDQLGADVAAFEAHYATVLQTAQYRIFAIPQDAS